MVVSLAGYAVDMRHPRVHVPACADSYLPAVTGSLKAGLYTYKSSGADALQLTLRFGFRARLTARVRPQDITAHIRQNPRHVLSSKWLVQCVNRGDSHGQTRQSHR